MPLMTKHPRLSTGHLVSHSHRALDSSVSYSSCPLAHPDIKVYTENDIQKKVNYGLGESHKSKAELQKEVSSCD